MPFVSSDVLVVSGIGLSVLLTVTFGNASFEGTALTLTFSLELYLLTKLEAPGSCCSFSAVYSPK